MIVLVIDVVVAALFRLCGTEIPKLLHTVLGENATHKCKNTANKKRTFLTIFENLLI